MIRKTMIFLLAMIFQLDVAELLAQKAMDSEAVNSTKIQRPPPLALTTLGFETTPKELGMVSWTRDWEAALRISRETRRPLFVLFQEVPG